MKDMNLSINMRIVLLIWSIGVAAHFPAQASDYVAKKQLESGAVLSVNSELYTTNLNMHVLEQTVVLQRTNGQSVVVWRHIRQGDEDALPLLRFFKRTWGNIHDLYYDEESGVFIMISERYNPITVTTVKTPPFPGDYPVKPNATNVLVNDYEYELKAGTNIFIYDTIESATASKTGGVYCIRVEVRNQKRGQPDVYVYRRIESGWELFDLPKPENNGANQLKRIKEQ